MWLGFSGVFLVPLEQFDRDALRPPDEANPDPWPYCRGILGEFHALGLDLGGYRVDVLYRQPEMIEALVGRHRRGINTVAGRHGGDEHVGTAQLDVDSAGTADDLPTQDVAEPGGHCLRIGTAQVDMVPGDGDRHAGSPW